MSPCSLLSLLIAFASPVVHAQATDTSDAFIPNGWAAFPQAYIGKQIRSSGDGGYVIDAVAKSEKQPRVCMKARQPVEGRVRVKGRWKRDGLVADAAWKGAHIELKFFNAENKLIKGKYSGQYSVRAGHGTVGWEAFSKAYAVPPGAKTAKVCTQIRGAFEGSAAFADLQLTDTASQPKGNGKNVLLIVMDTMRADVAGVYGNRAGLTPRLDAFAKKALVVERAWTQYTWTTPSYVSYMTSQYARTHGWTYHMGGGEELYHLDNDAPTLAEVLLDQGYVTAGVTVNGRVDHKVSMDRGFESWNGPAQDKKALLRVNEDLDLWKQDGAPNFLYVHLMTTHTPLRPSAEGQKVAKVSVKVPDEGVLYFKDSSNPMPTEAQHQAMFRDAYMASVYDADKVIDTVIKSLESRGLGGDQTLVAVFSDHGELLGEHGLNGHGPHVYEQLTWIPFIVRAPWMKTGRLNDRVAGLIDMAPTVLDALDLSDAIPEVWQGSSLFKPPTRSITVSERVSLMAFSQDGKHKTIELNGGKIEGAYDIVADPNEENDLGAAHSSIAPLHEAAMRWRTDTPKGTNDGRPLLMSTKEKNAELEKLKALGYIE